MFADIPVKIEVPAYPDRLLLAAAYVRDTARALIVDLQTGLDPETGQRVASVRLGLPGFEECNIRRPYAESVATFLEALAKVLP
jgi:hypothetical protein